MIELAELKWDNPKRAEIVYEISKWSYEYYIGGKPWTFLFQTKGIVVKGDMEKVKNLLESES